MLAGCCALANCRARALQFTLAPFAEPTNHSHLVVYDPGGDQLQCCKMSIEQSEQHVNFMAFLTHRR